VRMTIPKKRTKSRSHQPVRLMASLKVNFRGGAIKGVTRGNWRWPEF
jgi:hypothetical protein